MELKIIRPAISESLRNAIFEKDGFKCKECSATEDLTIDHIVPLQRGGMTIEDNLQTLCRKCNSEKGAKLKQKMEEENRPKPTRKYNTLDYKDKDVALTLFALGAGVNFVTRKLHRRGKTVSHSTVSDMRKRMERDGLIEERRQQIGVHIPMISKYVRILHLQETVEDIDEKLKASTEAYPDLLKVKKDYLRQIAEEMGDIKKGGVNVHTTINVPDKPEYPDDTELRSIVQRIGEGFSVSKN